MDLQVIPDGQLTQAARARNAEARMATGSPRRADRQFSKD
jgi:hypothetical protein